MFEVSHRCRKLTGNPLAWLGAGWVGLTTAACFAELGHDVVVRDVAPERVAALNAGEVPIHEPGLASMLARNRDRIHFTADPRDIVAATEIVFVCVGTPSTHSGDADLSAVWRIVDELADVEEPLLLVMKSTVPVGTGEEVRARFDGLGLAHIGYVANPEFLAEGTALADFNEPDRVVVGALRRRIRFAAVTVGPPWKLSASSSVVEPRPPRPAGLKTDAKV